jgi:ArsR family transcriptional regulator, arsenate/arsenite/antimonite-responsive transcriptional repressor
VALLCHVSHFYAGDEMDSVSAVAALAALGHSLRLEVWRMLLPQGPLGLTAGSIAERLSVAPSSLSFHLQQMTHGRVLIQRRSSRHVIYAVNNEVVDALCDFLVGGVIIQIVPGSLAAGQAGDIVGER